MCAYIIVITWARVICMKYMHEGPSASAYIVSSTMLQSNEQQSSQLSSTLRPSITKQGSQCSSQEPTGQISQVGCVKVLA